MREYLETMQVDPLAIEAHEKGEKEADTIHTIDLSGRRVKIVKRSRVNNDIVVDLELGSESVEYLQPGDRPKRLLATSNHPGHVQIESSLQTLNNGKAIVTDVKELVQEEEDNSVLVQRLTIVNDETQKSHSLVRYFIPYLDTPPHLLSELDKDE